MLISAVPEELCLNYANTLMWRGSETPEESLHELADLLGWIERSAGLSARASREIKNLAHRHPRTAARVFAEAVAIREVIFRVFSAIALGQGIGDPDFAALKGALVKAPKRIRLERAGDSYAWRIEPLRLSAPEILAPVLWSAGDLVLNAGHRRIRQCANERCLWLFVDESKNASRRWCAMASCGNRAKARRHYSRLKQR